MPFKKIWFVAALLVFVGAYLALYWHSLPFPFEFDDFPQILQNRSIRYLFHPRAFLESENLRSRPVTNLSFALSYAMGGFSLSNFRIFNVLLHLANAFFVGYFFWFTQSRRKGALGAALIAGALFLLHPLAADSVVYLSARSSLLVLFFMFAALYFYTRPLPTVFSWLSFLLMTAAAFLSKENGLAILPLLFLFHPKLKRRAQELIPYVLPILLGGALMGLRKATFLNAAGKGFFRIAGDIDISSFSEYLRIALSVWPMNFALFFRPDWMAVDHQLVLPASWFSPAVLAGIGIWLAFAAAAYVLWKFRSDWAFYFLWIVCALFVTNSIFPVLDPLGERHLYAALPAFAWLFALITLRVPRLAAVCLVATILPFAYHSAKARIEIWRSPETLWRDAYEKYPGKLRIVYNVWWSLITKEEKAAEALAIMQRFLVSQPAGALTYEDQEISLTSMANALRQSAKRSSRSIEAEARQIFGPLEYWSGLILLKATINEPHWRERWKEARAVALHTPLSPRPRDPEFIAHVFDLQLADYYIRVGNQKEALRLFEKVLLAFPRRHFPFWTKREDLGDLYHAAGRDEEALEQYEAAAYQYKVFKQFPGSLHRKLHEIYMSRKDYLRASDALGEILRVRTDDPDLRRQYASLLSRIGSQNAAQQFREADFYSQRRIFPQDRREIVRP
jgi:tetratricopeptide (TPR) repeat protein